MATERFVLLGLAQARSAWFRDVAQWANSAAVPAEFSKCVSAEELRARLTSGRPHSAVLVDAGLPSVDRDLVDIARLAGCAVLVVDDPRVVRDWAALGVDVVLPSGFSPAQLTEALAQHARPIGRAAPVDDGDSRDTPFVGWRARVAAVTGPGGTGASTVAIALAQGLGDDVRHAGMVLLADFRLNAEQAMLHDARDVVPGVQELADAHRSGRPTLEEVRALTFHVPARRYHLLLGLRQSRFWASVRPRAFEASLESLCRAHRVVVSDIDADLEGEDEGGSIDVQERHVMARTVVERADVVMAVGLPSMKGLHSLVRVVHELVDHGLPPERVLPVLNRAPRSPQARAGLAATLAELTGLGEGRALPASPLFLQDRALETALRDGARLPSGLSQPLAGAFRATLERSGQRAPSAGPSPRPVRPGELGHWADEAVGG